MPVWCRRTSWAAQRCGTRDCGSSSRPSSASSGTARATRPPVSPTAAQRTSEPPSRAPCAGSAPTTSTCTTSTASTRARPSRTPPALAELVAEGKIRHFGLSEAAPDDHPPRSRRPSGRRAADRVLAVDPRRGGGDPAAAARARHRLRPLLAARAMACSPGRSAPSTTSPTTTGARPTPASPARTSAATSPSSTRSSAIGAEIGATPAQTALAWLLTRGDDIAPIPGTRRVSRVEENTAADAIELHPTSSTGSTTSSPPPANATTRPTWHRSTAEAREVEPTAPTPPSRPVIRARVRHPHWVERLGPGAVLRHVVRCPTGAEVLAAQ